MQPLGRINMFNFNKLTDNQQTQLVRHMNQHENDSYEVHALWAKNNFGVVISKEDCFKLYLQSLAGGDAHKAQQMEMHGGEHL